MISIILPIYNVELFITECLDSILYQTYQDFEVIAIDDCGEDNSMSIIESYCEKLNITIIHHDHNRGLSAARNSGLEVAKGDYILFVDSDDILAPNCLEKLIVMAEKSLADMIIGNVECFGEESNNIPRLKYAEETIVEGRDNAMLEYLQGKYYMMAWNKLIRKDFLLKKNLHFEDGLIHEDNPWALKVACKAERIAIVPDVTYHYRIRKGSIQTDKQFEKHFEAYCRIVKLIDDEVKGIIASNVKNVDYLLYWWERQKALFYGSTHKNGSKKQCEEIYSIIHNTEHNSSLSRYMIHYLLPINIGRLLYNKWHGIWLI